jgi:uridine phosphorylase
MARKGRRAGAPFSMGRGASLVQPRAFCHYLKEKGLLSAKAIPNRIIVCFHQELAEFLKNKCQCKSVEGYWKDRLFIAPGRDDIAVLANFGIGAPATVSFLEELIALGAKEFIGVGTAGALQADIRIGDVVLCAKAIRAEGTSYHYLPASKYAHASLLLLKKIQARLRDHAIPFRTGVSWTTDAPYRETQELAARFRKEKVLTVEMEAASVYALAKYRGVRAAFLMVVSDYLFTTEWQCALRDGATVDTLEEVALLLSKSGQ